MGYWARRGADVNVRDPFGGRGFTALLHAAFFGHVDTVRYLVLELGACLVTNSLPHNTYTGQYLYQTISLRDKIFYLTAYLPDNSFT